LLRLLGRDAYRIVQEALTNVSKHARGTLASSRCSSSRFLPALLMESFKAIKQQVERELELELFVAPAPKE
jgi:nitrate/nitrite-specific signal transduction histidine kinase